MDCIFVSFWMSDITAAKVRLPRKANLKVKLKKALRSLKNLSVMIGTSSAVVHRMVARNVAVAARPLAAIPPRRRKLVSPRRSKKRFANTTIPSWDWHAKSCVFWSRF